MIRTVVWTKSAEDQLATIWAESDDRAAVAAAANKLDGEISADADSLGESRSPGFRIALEKPLGVTFHINDRDALVEVGRVWRFA